MEFDPRNRHDQRMLLNSITTTPTGPTDPIATLRRVLVANATTSGLGGLTALVAGGRVDRWLGTAHPGWVRIVGAGLVAFALAVVALSRSNPERLRRWAPAVSMGDGGWVAGSVATIAASWYSSGGGIIIAVVAVMVGIFAVLQWRLSRSARPGRR